ncbi:hypothetical protein BASA81_017165 [Batrachochytrium salamandrivorans]|nr:hypothetical protein BASA81_017165 [Batrachochytrium salamandrivorans]
MVERMHAMLGHGLTTLGNGKRDRWDEYLPQVLLALRTRTHAVTGYSPFFLLFGINPRLPYDETPPQSSMAPLDEIERMEETPSSLLEIWMKSGQARSAANVRTKAQAEAMRKRNGFDQGHTRLVLQGRRHGKAKTPRTVEARVQMERPISRCQCRSSGNLLVDDSPGTPIPKCNHQSDLAPWLAPVIDNADFFMMEL